MSNRKFLNHTIGFTYKGYIYQWDFAHGCFIPKQIAIDNGMPKKLLVIPNGAYNINFVTYDSYEEKIIHEIL